MTFPGIDTVADHRCLLGEGPVWDSKEGSIYWIDILSGDIHRYHLAQKSFTTHKTGQVLGAIARRAQGGLVAAFHNGFALIAPDTQAISYIGDPEAHLPGNRFNDGKVDPLGNFWAGTMSYSETPGAGSLYRLGRDFSITRQTGNVTISNGMAWSPDHQTFYYIDTTSAEVVSYRFDVHTGGISDKKSIVTIAPEDGHPDGMTIDDEGMLWIAHWDGWQVTRWDPHTGKKLSHIRLPAARITSCTFGGETLEDLYITSAKNGLTAQQLAQQPLAGALFVIRNCGYKGMPAFEFGG